MVNKSSAFLVKNIEIDDTNIHAARGSRIEDPRGRGQAGFFRRVKF